MLVGGKKGMACRTYEERTTIQRLLENSAQEKEIAGRLDALLSSYLPGTAARPRREPAAGGKTAMGDRAAARESGTIRRSG